MKFTVFAVTFVFFGLSLAQTNPWDPQPRDDNWLTTHETLVNLTLEHAKDEKLVFIGDSITRRWSEDGKNIWAKFYAPRQAYNYGVGGDETQHVLYRIENKEFDGIYAKVAVLMIGMSSDKQRSLEI